MIRTAMVREKEDHKTHLYRVASSNLPVVPRKSWEYYVAILQPGIALEKCEHGDFLWIKVKGTVTIEKILTLHFKRTGRNSILMDGDIGLSIDTKIEDIKCLGLGVYAFWEIVKVEKWWEYTVSSTSTYADERMRSTKEEKHGRLLENTVRSAMTSEEKGLINSSELFQDTSIQHHSIDKKEESGGLLKLTVASTMTAYEEMGGVKFKRKTKSPLSEKKEEKPWSWETTMPSIIDNTVGARGKQTLSGISKNKSSMAPSVTMKEEKSKERSGGTSTNKTSYVIKAGQKRKIGKTTKEEMLKRELAQEDRAEVIKRRRMELESEDATKNIIKQMKMELDEKLDLMKSKNDQASAIKLLKPFAEDTKLGLKRHDDYVAKQRKNMEANSQRLGKSQFKDILERFEISWERQRQDIINRDPQFKLRVAAEPQKSTGKITSKFQDHDSFESILKEREIHLDLEAIQRQLDIAKREYSQSKFTLRYSGNTVRLECAYCPNINIQMGLKDSRNVAGIVKRHQTSKYHTDNRYHEAQRKCTVRK
ncbi:uncharacterized protein EAE98_006694 [Botrytis deweyae]|uniref:CS domain-containing protein n=1 Tax=Botrytis deweyae TaxID=2478750 RepID=A0ABQ7IK26_9HELO|nr:uncharacterized protein EAE98_006694 [Botrytis deweyae]KAF7926399.1 hypothetical protein EAE98_006694 [Botrytis deweyae]